MNRESIGAYYDHDNRRRIQVMTFGEFKELAKKSQRLVYPYQFDEIPDSVLGIIDGLTFTILDLTYEAERVLRDKEKYTVETNKNVMCFPNTGLGDEEFSYIETERSPTCSQCRYRYNSKEVAPCFDCTGFQETGRSYFQENRGVSS